jgi:hypothetical protein
MINGRGLAFKFDPNIAPGVDGEYIGGETVLDLYDWGVVVCCDEYKADQLRVIWGPQFEQGKVDE